VAEEFLLQQLRHRHPGEAVLSEESPDDGRRLTARRVWIVDPLDGTREFTEGRDDWAVHVSLVIDGQAAAGAVALPAQGRTLSTDQPPSVPRRRGPLRLVVSRSRPPTFIDELAGRLGARVLTMGSAGAKTVAVVDGTADAYVHAGGMYEWDAAAPVAVATAAGLHACRLDGSGLMFNRPDPYLPDLLVCRVELVDPLLATLP
jgi:3'(2'), 5'-bisphosphate nucleotidase